MKIEVSAESATLPTVADLMQRSVISVPADMPVLELALLLTEQQISGAPVVDAQGEVIGVVSLYDIATHALRGHGEVRHRHERADYYRDLWMEDELTDGFVVEDYGATARVEDIMTRVVYIVNDQDSLMDLVNVMLGARIHRVLVSDGEKVVGIVTTMDILRVVPRLCLEHARHFREPW